MKQNNKKRKIRDCEIYDDKYLIQAVDGQFTELWIYQYRHESILSFFETVRLEGKRALTNLIKKMQAEGVRIEDISARLISELKNDSKIGEGYLDDCIQSLDPWNAVMELKYERRYGISRGLFELAKRIKIEYPRYILRPAVREELIKMFSKCRTRRDLTRALTFETLADDSPVLRYILQRSRQ